MLETFLNALLSFDIDLWRCKRAFAKNRAGFYNSLAKTLGKVPMTASLAKATEINEGTPLGNAYRVILARFGQGQKLVAAFEGYAPTSDLQVLRAMQSSMKSDRDLSAGFARLASTAKDAGRSTKAMVQASRSVFFAASGFVAGLFILHGSLLPQIVKIFPIMNWSSMSRLIYMLIEFVFSHGTFAMLLSLSALGLYFWSITNWGSQLRHRLDQTLFYGWYKDYRSTSTLISLAMQLGSGASIGAALKELLLDANPWEGSYINLMLHRNDGGTRGGEIFDVGFFPVDVTTQLVLLAQSGNTVDAFVQIGIEAQTDLVNDFISRISLTGETIKNIFFSMTALQIIFVFSLFGEYMAQTFKF